MTNIPYLIKQNASRWNNCSITPSKKAEVMLTARRLVAQTAKDQYVALQNTTNVPWFVIAVIHEREADQNFNDSLAQGDPWRRVSTHVPRGRGPFKSFFAAGVDSLVKCAPFASRWRDWSPGGSMTLLELYNGTGYENYHHEASPYIWGATNHQEWGKYVSDGVYSAHAWDTQLGCAAMLLGMIELDSSITFGSTPIDVPGPIQETPVLGTIDWVQYQLNKAGYNLVQDGINGANTHVAIKDFQKKHNLVVDGIVGDATIEALKGIK